MPVRGPRPRDRVPTTPTPLRVTFHSQQQGQQSDLVPMPVRGLLPPGGGPTTPTPLRGTTHPEWPRRRSRLAPTTPPVGGTLMPLTSAHGAPHSAPSD